MIAGNHHGAPEPHMWLLLTPGIDLWKATNRNGVPPDFFPAWQLSPKNQSSPHVSIHPLYLSLTKCLKLWFAKIPWNFESVSAACDGTMPLKLNTTSSLWLGQCLNTVPVENDNSGQIIGFLSLKWILYVYPVRSPNVGNPPNDFSKKTFKN